MATKYRVYKCPDGCDISYCGEFDSLEDAKDFADGSPSGLAKCLWDTYRAAGGMHASDAPDKRGVESDEPLSWHGELHCVVRVEYLDN